jgi:Bacteriophage tail sheath protein
LSTLELPGYRVVSGERPIPEEGLRNDVAAFLGRTDRGPLGLAVRVASRHAYAAVYGRQRIGLATPRAVEAYFANEGEVAWVLRTGRGGAAASAEVELGAVSGGTWAAGGPARLTLPGNRLRVTATSPGLWACGTTVKITYRAFSPTGAPELDVRIVVPDEPVIQRSGLTADELLPAIGSSGLLTAAFAGKPVTAEAADPSSGPSQRLWRCTLGGGAEPSVERRDYLDAVLEQAQIDEIALVCAPDLDSDLDEPEQEDIVAALASAAATGQDRLVVLATPLMRPTDVGAWHERLLEAVPDSAQQKAVAAYAPWLVAEDLTHSSVDRYVPTNPVGHVCGVISRLDRERGSGWAPSNVLVNDAIDIAAPSSAAEQVFAISRQVNLLRCRAGGGLEIWGARTLDPGDGRHLAHRRLVHRIVRAIRRVCEPLVFDTNNQLLWFAVVRAVSRVLLEAFRSGFLQGETPDEAYRVRCDETTNTADRIDAGQVVCEIEIAPAAPMEFITLRLTLGAQGLLEVVEQ